MRTKTCLDAADARKIAAACKAEAEKNNWKISVAVTDEAGSLIHLERMDGAPLQSPEIATGKARTSAMARVPTKMLEDTVKERPAMLTLATGRVPVQGGLPVMHKDECVGAVGVSGVKSHEDEQIAKAGLAAIQ